MRKEIEVEGRPYKIRYGTGIRAKIQAIQMRGVDQNDLLRATKKMMDDKLENDVDGILKLLSPTDMKNLGAKWDIDAGDVESKIRSNTLEAKQVSDIIQLTSDVVSVYELMDYGVILTADPQAQLEILPLCVLKSGDKPDTWTRINEDEIDEFDDGDILLAEIMTLHNESVAKIREHKANSNL